MACLCAAGMFQTCFCMFISCFNWNLLTFFFLNFFLQQHFFWLWTHMKALIYYLDFGSNQIWQVIIKNKMLILKIYKKKSVLHTKNRKEEPVWQNFITFVVIHGCCSNDCPVLLQGQVPCGALWGWKVPGAGLLLPPTARTWALWPHCFQNQKPRGFWLLVKGKKFPTLFLQK